MAVKSNSATWDELNERQRQFLTVIYERDQAAEAAEKGVWNRGQRSRPADQWRWLPYNSEGGLQQALGSRYKIDDPGIGSTHEALKRRGLVETKITREQGLLGPWDLLWLKLTTRGRAVVRSGLGVKLPKKLPAGTLQRWQWEALQAAYQAGESGLIDTFGTGKYGGFSWQSCWLRLRDRGFAAEKSRPLPGGRSRHVVCITTQGRAYVEAEAECYRALYGEEKP
jgi:hypothetical protein